MSDPKQPSCAKPTSSRTTKTTFGVPAGGRGRGGHHGFESQWYRPITPPKSRAIIAWIVPRRLRGRREALTARPHLRDTFPARMDALGIVLVAAGLVLAPTAARAQPSTQRPTFAIVAGGNQHTCAVLAGAAPGAGVGVQCWGRNQEGELGDFTQTDRPRPVPVMSVTDAVRLATDFQHVC